MASWAELSAFRVATTAAISKPISSPDPATAAAGAQTKKTPAPTIEARPMAIAPGMPRCRCSVFTR